MGLPAVELFYRPLPSIAMQNLLLVVAVVLVMTTFIGYTLAYLRRNAEEFTIRKLAYMVLVLTMMASMLNAINYFIATSGGFFNTIVAVNLAMFAMTIAIVYLLWISTQQKITKLTARMAFGFSLLFAWNEISMGAFLFSLAYSPAERLAMSGTGSILSYLVSGVNSYLFVIPMVSEMIFILIYFGESRFNKILFGSLIAMSAATPSMIIGHGFLITFTVIFTAVMVASMIVVFEWIANRRNTITAAEMKNLEILFLIFLVMSLGVFFGGIYGSPFYISWMIYAAGMIAGMVFYFHTALETQVKGKRLGWVKHPRFLFLILLTSFISEFFVSGTILFLIQPDRPPGFQAFVAFSALLGGVNSVSVPSIAIDIPYVIGAVTNSYIFLSVMGIEMGALVILRMRKLQWREKRVNLSLALVAFALYTVFWPNFGNESFYSVLPVWANAGALGPMYPYFIGALIGSYALYAVLALLFGRRSYCSTLCPSAVMYGGTLGQGMIAFNYESKISKANIGSKFKAAIYPFISVSWVFMISLSFLSYATVGKIDNFNIYGIDPVVFFSFFVWNFLWYLFFIAIPFIGMSPCRRYGWCTTGTFVGFFSKLGLFKLKVRDSDVCRTCPTKDCVTACEVGLGDLAGQFIKQGYFKSSKCVGAGSCLEACPYDNIFFYDIRNFIKEKRGKNISRRP